MRSWLIVALSAILLTTLPLGAEEKVPTYSIADFSVGEPRVNPDGKQGIYFTVRFTLVKPEGVKATPRDVILIKEEGVIVKTIPLQQTEVQPLSTVLALDISGSMEKGNKLGEAKSAAGVFLDMLNNRADTGLILFDHEVPVNDPRRYLKPSGTPREYARQSTKVRGLIDGAIPLGGTAYLDATYEALDMLRTLEGRKAVVLMTDGVDMNSKNGLEDVIKKARANGIPVYALGIGEKGLNERVTTVMVLDHSGSMAGRANDTDPETKIQALRKAAVQFVDLMRPSAQTTLLPFSSLVETPRPFTHDKGDLAKRIRDLRPEGGTSLYDATLAGVETLVVANPPGKKAVVVLTDGKDESPGSRYSDQAVIERAREVKIPLYMLGLGRKREINEPVMKRMASETGGAYYYAGSAKELIKVFEKLSIDLHDDGIDEASLTRLAGETGGKYRHVRDVADLKFAFQDIAAKVQSDYVEEIKSTRGSLDGTAREIKVSIARRAESSSGNPDEIPQYEELATEKANKATRGLLVPEQAPLLYLGILGGIGGLLAIPALLRAMNGTGRAR